MHSPGVAGRLPLHCATAPVSSALIQEDPGMLAQAAVSLQGSVHTPHKHIVPPSHWESKWHERSQLV
jgi:hypothetical protein